jgi:hypothetical protein
VSLYDDSLYSSALYSGAEAYDPPVSDHIDLLQAEKNISGEELNLFSSLVLNQAGKDTEGKALDLRGFLTLEKANKDISGEELSFSKSLILETANKNIGGNELLFNSTLELAQGDKNLEGKDLEVSGFLILDKANKNILGNILEFKKYLDLGSSEKNINGNNLDIFGVTELQRATKATEGKTLTLEFDSVLNLQRANTIKQGYFLNLSFNLTFINLGKAEKNISGADLNVFEIFPRGIAIMLQKAVYERLSAVLDVPVYDDVPENFKAPFVVIGDDVINEFDTDAESGFDVDVNISVYSTYRGREEVKKIQGEIYAALHRYPLVIQGYKYLGGDFEHANTFLESDGITRRGVQRFRSLIR